MRWNAGNRDFHTQWKKPYIFYKSHCNLSSFTVPSKFVTVIVEVAPNLSIGWLGIKGLKYLILHQNFVHSLHRPIHIWNVKKTLHKLNIKIAIIIYYPFFFFRKLCEVLKYRPKLDTSLNLTQISSQLQIHSITCYSKIPVKYNGIILKNLKK